MHAGLADIAEWLGYEVIDVEGEAVVRQRVNRRGAWMEREQRATAVEVRLYDAVRGLMMAQGSGDYVGMLMVAKAFGHDTRDGVSVKLLLDTIATTLTESRQRKEAYEKAAELVNQLRDELILAHARIEELLGAPRFVPKGGDRNELARQVRGIAQRLLDRHDEDPEQITLAMGVVNTVLRLLGSEPVNDTLLGEES